MKHLRHVVLFGFRDGTPPEKIAEIERAFESLPDAIEGITDFEWGTNVSPENHAHGYTHCFLVTFDSEAARDAYLPHPAHAAFGTLLKPYLEKVCVVDYRPR